jgi:YVTN family beta-propeller protein
MTKLILSIFVISLTRAQDAPPQQKRPPRPPKPGVSTPGVKREMSVIKPDAVFPVEGAPDWQVVTDDAVWVTSAPKNAVHRLDVKTNQVVAVVTVGKKPCSGLAAGFGSIWVPNCGDKTLSRIDIKTNQVVDTLPFGPADSEGGIAASPDSIWMLTDKKGILSRIDPVSKKATEIAVTPNSAACFYAQGAVWITTPEKNLLTRVDAKTNQLTNTIEVGPGPRFLTAGAGSIWTLNQGDGTVSRVDAHSAKLVANIEAGIPGSGGEIAFGAGHVWATAIQIPITEIDPEKNAVIKQWVGRGGDSIRVGHGSVWLSNLRDQNVWRFKTDQP